MPLSRITGNSFNATANTNIDNGLLFLNPTTNRVGVGITTPTAPFHAYTNAALNNTIAVFQNDISTPGYLGEVILSAPNRPAVRTNYRTSNDTNGFFNYDTGEFKFFANAGGSPSEVMRANRFGVGLGSNSPSSGMGIMFPASQSASSDPNTLDDYEEGTWTPSISGDGVLFSGTTYTARQGNYVKIGRQVTVMFDITVSVVGTRAGNASVNGLPFPIQSTGDLSGGGGSLGLCQNLASAFVYQSIYPQNNSSFLYIIAKTGAGSDSFILSSSSFYQNNTRITGSVTYITNT